MTTDFAAAREAMVAFQLERRGISDQRLLAAMRAVPREAFIGAGVSADAYTDGPLPIGEGQTISQPYVVALMIEAAAVGADDSVLEVGAGSGYAAAILGRIAARVHAIERRPTLAAAAAERLARLGFDNVCVQTGDGSVGWPEAAPFDAILVAAAGPQVPEALKSQLAIGGRLVMPVGRRALRTIAAQGQAPVRSRFRATGSGRRQLRAVDRRRRLEGRALIASGSVFDRVGAGANIAARWASPCSRTK